MRAFLPTTKQQFFSREFQITVVLNDNYGVKNATHEILKIVNLYLGSLSENT